MQNPLLVPFLVESSLSESYKWCCCKQQAAIHYTMLWWWKENSDCGLQSHVRHSWREKEGICIHGSISWHSFSGTSFPSASRISLDGEPCKISGHRRRETGFQEMRWTLSGTLCWCNQLLWVTWMKKGKKRKKDEANKSCEKRERVWSWKDGQKATTWISVSCCRVVCREAK